MKKIGAIFLICMLFTTCKKNAHTRTEAIVYVAGYNRAADAEAVVWKNGMITSYSSTAPGQMFAVQRKGSDLYSVGYLGHPDSIQYALIYYWKNDTPHLITSGKGKLVSSMFVTDDDVYVTTSEFKSDMISMDARFWKNGIPTTLTDGAQMVNTTTDIFVSGSDVYVTGTSKKDQSSWPSGRLWKNGVSIPFENQDISVVNSVYVVGTDVYMAGYELFSPNFRAKFWKNGVQTLLSDGSTQAKASDILSAGVDVYVVGEQGSASSSGNTAAMVWKNGTASPLTNGSFSAAASSVVLFGNDLYVSGYQREGSATVAVFWKNGTATVLSKNQSWGRAICVGPQP